MNDELFLAEIFHRYGFIPVGKDDGISYVHNQWLKILQIQTTPFQD